MGTISTITDVNYLGIESVWNNTNYWVNLQEVPLSVCAIECTNSSEHEHFIFHYGICGGGANMFCVHHHVLCVDSI